MTVMVLMRDAQNLTQDSDSGNVDMDMDFTGSYEGVLHNLMFSWICRCDGRVSVIWGNWMDEGVIAKRDLFSMTFRDVTASPMYAIYKEGLSGQDERGCLQSGV